METIVIAILVLIVLVVSIMLYTKYINRGAEKIDGSINGLNDFDKDNIADIFDKCPCDPGEDIECKTAKEECDKKRSIRK